MMTPSTNFPAMNLLQDVAGRIRVDRFPVDRVDLVDAAAALGAAAMLALAGLAVHAALVFVVRRIVRRTRTARDEALLPLLSRPLRWIIVALVLLWTDHIAMRSEETAELVVTIAGTAMPLLWGWLAIAAIRLVHRYIRMQADLSAVDNLEARRKRTRADILARVATVVVAVIAVGLMLLKIPAVREVGMALVASAGLAGLAVGVAAQPLLKNLVAGMQLAFTEPLRIDDVIVFRGEWARVESITLTYVVLKIWDDRRLVVPVANLMEEPIENWTRETSHLLGTVMVYVDHAADVDRLREIAIAAVEQHPLWDGRVAKVQVTDMTAQALEVRVLMSGRDGSELFELRCDVREAVTGFIARELSGSLNRSRVALEPPEKS
ncbi:mechanosensitive ion channel domain-containing protein [Erythrobacter sp.]|uniref:mechanosensitive ion channel family protein n=1 Tax=Erythrobacter sp. TaxID=1042 RepID=UPI0025FBA2D2|nr:mechanosensitive ion channel domain-containing protein [Erythrobacter sp.]